MFGFMLALGTGGAWGVGVYGQQFTLQRTTCVGASQVGSLFNFDCEGVLFALLLKFSLVFSVS